MRFVRPLLLSLLLVPALVFAAAEEGQSLPSFKGRDLHGVTHHSSEYRGEPMLVVVMTDQKAEPLQRAWFDTAQQHGLPNDVRRISIVTLKLPFFASWDMMRSRAAKEVPPEYWTDTLLDRDGAIARTLEFPPSTTPYAMALDANGNIVALAHGGPNSPDAQRVWSALRSAGSAPQSP